MMFLAAVALAAKRRSVTSETPHFGAPPGTTGPRHRLMGHAQYDRPACNREATARFRIEPRSSFSTTVDEPLLTEVMW
jgi:hypothetical protein